MNGRIAPGLAVLLAVSAAGCAAMPPERASLETTVRPTALARDLEPVTRGPAAEVLPSISADGRFLWYQSSGPTGDWDVCRMAFPGGSETRSSFREGFDGAPAAWADGEAAVFVSVRGGAHGLWSARADGAGGTRRLLELRGVIDRPAPAPDGATLAFGLSGGASRGESWICTCEADGSGLVELARGAWPAWSPDGARLAFVRDDGGMTPAQVWTMNRDGGDQRRLTDVTGRPGAARPAWSPDGRLIAFDAPYLGSPDTDIWLVPAEGGAAARLTCSYGPENGAAWTPDGRVAFAAETLDAAGNSGNWNIWILRPTAFTR